MHKGTRYQRSTGIPVGEGREEQAENRAKAEALQKDWTAPYALDDEADLRATLAERSRKAEEAAAEKWEEVNAAENRIPLDETVWERFPYNMSQRTRGRKKVHRLSEDNIAENKGAWERFVRWCNLAHGQGNAKRATAPRRGRPRKPMEEAAGAAGAVSAPLPPAEQARADKAEALRFHGLYLQDVTPEWAQEYSRALLAEGLTPQRHNKLITTAGVMFRIVAEACPDARLANPFEDVAKERDLEAESREPFTPAQVAKLIDTAAGWKGSRCWNGAEWRGFLAVLYFTGMRRGDAALLKHENRNRTRTPVEIKFVARKPGKRVEIVEHEMLTAILEETAAPGKRGYLFPGLAAEYKRNPRVLSQRFAAYMRSVLGELEADGDGKAEWVPFDGTEERTQGGKLRVSRYGLHSFRHSFATHCAAAGIPIGTVQKWLGHSRAEITQIYAIHEDKAGQAKVMDAITIPLAGFPSRLALPAAEGGDGEAKAATAERTVETLRRALGEMVAVLAKATAANWMEKRKEALAVAARAERECKA